MKSKNTNGFTLVELIIVITILAILATIAFISFQGYTKSARDGKVKSEIRSIVQSLSAKEAQYPGNLNVYLDSTTTTNHTPTTLNIKGKTATPGTFGAGRLKNESIELKSDNKYYMGYTNELQAFQVVGVLQADGNQSHIDGNYSPRTQTNTIGTGTVTSGVIKLNDGFGLFKIGDVLEGGGEVVRISTDLKELTTSGTISGTNEFKLAVKESDSLLTQSGSTEFVSSSVLPE